MNKYTITLSIEVLAENTEDALNIGQGYVNQLNQESQCNSKLCSMYKYNSEILPTTKIFEGEEELKVIKHNIYKFKHGTI